MQLTIPQLPIIKMYVLHFHHYCTHHVMYQLYLHLTNIIFLMFLDYGHFRRADKKTWRIRYFEKRLPLAEKKITGD